VVVTDDSAQEKILLKELKLNKVKAAVSMVS
jgi:hypothetical protein